MNMNEINMVPDLKLRFNINCPDLEECYSEGYESALEEIAEENNPYKEGTLEHEYWQEGWFAGLYEEEPALTLEHIEEKSITEAANEKIYHYAQDFLVRFFKITSALAATALVGYQVL